MERYSKNLEKNEGNKENYNYRSVVYCLLSCKRIDDLE